MTAEDFPGGLPISPATDAGGCGRATEAGPGHQARAVFGDRLELVGRFADLLAGPGVEHGLIGPRELAQLWDRHLLNCAHLTELLPPGARVVDVGSGAGLPGLVLALRRPDLHVDLVEPMVRRTAFLSSAVESLGLAAQVRVVRGRADELHVRQTVGGADWATARAVAPLDRLVRWCLPLLTTGGQLLAIKGQRAETELELAGPSLGRVGGRLIDVVEVGSGASATRVVRIARSAPSRSKRKSR